jgi:energy-coupling factor transporter ATP-binding protein EcfA2
MIQLVPFTFLQQFILGLCCMLAATVSTANCDVLAQENTQHQQAIATANQTITAIQDLLSGNIPDDLRVITTMLAPLGVNTSRREIRKELTLKQTNLARTLGAADNLQPATGNQDCGELESLWLQTLKQYQRSQLSLLALELKLLELPEKNLRLLVRQLQGWDRVAETKRALFDARTSLSEPAKSTLTSDSVALDAWIENYQNVSERWLALFIRDAHGEEELNKVWQRALSIPRAGNSSLWRTYREFFPEKTNQWKAQLITSRTELLAAISQWRNDVIWSAGLGRFLMATTSPQAFFDTLLTELSAAPALFVDNLTAPFIYEQAYYESKNQASLVLVRWLFQCLGLVLALYLVVKLSHATPSLFASAQQKMLSKLQLPSLIRLMSGLFWLIKPNAPWIVVLISTQLIAAFNSQMIILSFIGPIGLLYAIFRAVRIIFEWLLSRTYARAGEFVPPAAAERIALHTQYFSLSIVVCCVILGLSAGIGGGYLRFIIVIGVAVCAWWALFWLTHMHAKAITRFMPFGKKSQDSISKNTEPKIVQRTLITLVMPWIFLIAHLIDATRSMNEKLLSFDSYRSFTAKVMRARLESKTELDEDDDSEPDENYSDWMTRPATEKLIFDVGETSTFFEPIQRWHQDKTDENLLLLVGESGSGKTTFVNQLPTHWTETNVNYIRFQNKTTTREAVFEAIAESLGQEKINNISDLIKLDEELSPQIIVVDDAHNLFIAEVGHFDAFRTLMHCMNAHLDNIFWVVVMHAPSWSYLSCVFSREQRFSNIHRMPRWSPQDIRRLVLARHQGGKRRLRFNELLLSAAASSESSSVRGADSRLFNILWEQSGGNPTAAISLWLNAAKVNGRTVEIGVPQRPSGNPLTGMKDDLYFIYAAIVTHRTMSTKEIMSATHFAEPIVRHALKQGINMGLIVRDSNGRYSIDSYWYGTLSSFLQKKNLLWH